MAVSTQVFVRHLSGRSLCLQIQGSNVSGYALKRRISAKTLIPPCVQRLVTGIREVTDEDVLKPDGSGLFLIGIAPATLSLQQRDLQLVATGSYQFPSINLLLRLRGGKGGFGSLLRGAANKAGQKKTNNFDACRDMSGRRLRHVNAERKLEEWKAEAEDRKLEKVAEEFLKKQMKKEKKRPSNARSENYLEKYREESSKSIDGVRAAVKESIGNLNAKGKGKFVEEEAQPSKRLKLWVLKEQEEDDDSDDNDDEEQSVILDNGNSDQSESCGQDVTGTGSPISASADSGIGTDGSSGSDSGIPQTNDASSECVSQQNGTDNGSGHDLVIENRPIVAVDSEEQKYVKASVGEQGGSGIIATSTKEKSSTTAPSSCTLNHVTVEPESVTETRKMDSVLNCGAGGSLSSSVDRVLNFDDFQTWKDMEVLDMEMLKTELQRSGLKCGGTLEQRAERLFLLKTMPVDMIPKKHLSKTNNPNTASLLLS